MPSLLKSVSRPVTFGVTMLMVLLTYTFLGRPGTSWVAWLEHFTADALVVVTMVLFAAVLRLPASSRERGGLWVLDQALELFSEPTRSVAVVLITSRVVGFAAAAVAYATVLEQASGPVEGVALLLGAFAVPQAVLVFGLRRTVRPVAGRAAEEIVDA